MGLVFDLPCACWNNWLIDSVSVVLAFTRIVNASCLRGCSVSSVFWYFYCNWGLEIANMIWI